MQELKYVVPCKAADTHVGKPLTWQKQWNVLPYSHMLTLLRPDEVYLIIA